MRLAFVFCYFLYKSQHCYTFFFISFLRNAYLELYSSGDCTVGSES